MTPGRPSCAARHILAGSLLLVGLLLPSSAAYAQAANWRVTVISITSEDWGVLCGNASETVTIPAPTGTVTTTLCSLTARFTVEAQHVVLALFGSVTIGPCQWTIAEGQALTGRNFISGDAVPSTSMTGTAQGKCPFGNYTNTVTGAFQAQRVIAGSGTTIASFTGTVQVTLPGRAPVVLTAGNAGGLVLTVGTRVQVAAGGSVTLSFSDGNVEIGENTDFTLSTARFFLLAPPRYPMRSSFVRIRWRCIPVKDGCVSLAMPNTRLAFLPPIGSTSVSDPRAGEEDVVFTVTYSQAGGLGTAVVTVETGRVDVQSLGGASAVVGAGQSRRVVALAAGGGALNLDGDALPDVFRYHAPTGAWTIEPGGGGPAVSGGWSLDWNVSPADIDGNGLTDFLLAKDALGVGRLMLNNGRGGFTETAEDWTPGWRSLVLNLNGDRLSDGFFHQPATGEWTQAINQGSGSFEEYDGQWDAGWTPYPLELNADDKADLLLFNSASGRWSWAVNNGAGGFTLSASGTWTGVTHVHPADFTADGRWDALLYDSRTGAWSLATNTGSGFSYKTGSAAAGRDIVVADLDADGDADAFLYDPGSGQWTILTSSTLSDGTAQLTGGASGSWAARWRIAATDFNSDGRADFFLYYPEAGTWRKAVNAGGGSFTYQDGMWTAGLTVLAGQTLAQGLLPNDALQASCTAEADLHSAGAAGTSSIEFVNMSSEVRQIHWLNALGRRVASARLAPGQRHVQPSPRAHVWVVTDGVGTCRGIYIAGDVPGRALLQ